MGDTFKEIYNILSGIGKLSLNKYQRLISTYGNDCVNQVIEYLILEDDGNFYKFDVCFSKVIDSVGDITDLSNYDIYLSDVRNETCMDAEKNMKLLKETYRLIQEMEKIFKTVGCDNIMLGKNRVPWIADKVEYCLFICKDRELLDKLNNLYKNYCQVRDRIVIGNLRLVITFANEYSDDLTSVEDIIQEGNVGLIRAIEKFDINKDVTFSTYASYWIIQGMTRGIKTIRYPMRLPINIIYKSSMMMDARNDLSLELGRNATDSDLLKYRNIPEKRIQEMLSYFSDVTFLDEIVESDFDDKECSLSELIADDRVNVFNDAVNLEYRNQLLNFLDNSLKEREYLVLKLYFGLGLDDVSYVETEIAKMLGLTQQAVGQIKKRALQNLKKKPNIRDIVIV